MATVITRAERPKVSERATPDRDLSGRYRVIHGDLIVPLDDAALKDAVSRGLPPYESLAVGSLVELTHDEADRILDHGVIEPENAPRKGQIAAEKAKAKRQVA